MKRICYTVFGILACPAIVLLPAEQVGDSLPVFNRVRFYPAPGREAVMVGGKFSGSNFSPITGFTVLAEIKAAPPANGWTELSFPNDKIYRYIRYDAPPGSHGNVAEVEFYSGKRKLTGNGFGTAGGWRTWQKALDGDTATWFDSSDADGQHVGLDLGDKFAAAKPTLEPAPGVHKEAVKVTLKCVTKGASIRYTMDGTTPSPDTGLPYTAPIAIDKTATLVAAAFKDGLAPSQPVSGIYHVGSEGKPGFTTLHIGNSLTNTTSQFAAYAKVAGHQHEYRSFTAGGALTVGLWDMASNSRKQEWQKLLDGMPRVDHLTCQPRDFNIVREAENDVRFFNVIRQKSPGFQPWLYVEWVEKNRQRPSDKGTVPSSQMKTLCAALTWEESMAAMLLYGEELQRKLAETYKEGKRPRIIPSCLAMGWVKNMIDRGELPGASAGSFYPLLFSDDVHPNANGAYLVDLTWFAALYGQTPEGKLLPFGSGLTPEQARAMQRLAWDTIKNYPDCGLYEEGKTPAGVPAFSPAPSALKEVMSVTLSSSTPGAWFRYTLDGTTPTRTTGYVYCGVVSVRPGMTIKAVAYKSGLADSPVAEAAYPTSK